MTTMARILGRPMPVDRAVEALCSNRSLFARPLFLRGEGEAFMLHGSDLHRRGSTGPAPALSAHYLLARWEVVTGEQLDAELRGEKIPRPKRAPRLTPPRSRRGPRTAAEVRATMPQSAVPESFLSVAEVAEEMGVSTDRIRRAVAAGRLASRFHEGRLFVTAAGARALFGTEPAPIGDVADDTEVYL
jgi:hypothetical protein